MSLNCVIGDVTFDKSKYIYEKTLELEQNDKYPIVFVPSQSRMLAEEEYLQKTNKTGMLNTNITTLSRYISNILEKNGFDKKYLSDEQKRIYIKKIIDDNREKFTLFSNIIDKPSFVDVIISYIDTLKKENITMEALENVNTDNMITKIKLAELSNICKTVKDSIDEKYMDSIDMLDMFTEHVLSNKKDFENKEIFFHGYNNFSKKELNIIKGFLELGINVTVSITLPVEYTKDNLEIDNIFEIPYKTYVDLKNLCISIGTKFNTITSLSKLEIKEDIEYLAKSIFNNDNNERYNKKSDNIDIKLEKNFSCEIENIAKDIISKTRKNKSLRWRDFAIYTNSFEEYEFCIKRIFDEYEINYHFDDTSYIQNTNLAIYILNILKIADEGIDIRKLMGLLKTGLFNISEDDLNYFENYILEFGIKEYLLNREFKKNNNETVVSSIVYDLNRLNNIRETVVKSIDCFSRKIADAKNIKDKILVIYNHIIDEKVIDRYIDEINLVTEENVKEGDLRKQVVEIIYEIFDNLVECSNEDIKLKAFISLLEFGMRDRKVKTIPMTIDQVEICDINKTRILPKKYIYIIGTYENGLPSISSEDSIFSDKELDELKNSDIDIKQNSIARTNMALFNAYLALANVKEHLTLTMPASRQNGEPLRKGIIINEVKRILDVPIIGNISEENEVNFEEETMTTKSMFRTLLQSIVNINDLGKDKLEYLYNLYLYYINDDEKYKEILEYCRKDENLSKETLERLYKDKINSSVSRLEMFSRCPFSYLNNYILNVKPRKKYTISAMDMGTLMHNVLEKFSKWIMERNLLWQQIITEEEVTEKAKNKINEIVDKVFEEGFYKYKDSNRYAVLKSRLKKKMFSIIKIIAESFNQSEFKPLGYEIEFRNGSLYSPIEVNLENGKTMYLVGKIDRVDTAIVDDKVYVRIIDYKSSNKTLTIKDIKEGISLQLMTYMSALINSREKIDGKREVIPAAVNYFTLKSDIKRIDEFTEDSEKIKKELIKSMKLKGIYLSDVKVIEKMDRKYKDTGSSFIDINKRNINDENRVISEDKFKEECQEIRKILKGIGKEITNGIVKIYPKSCNGKLPCEYCDYITICRKNIRA